MNKKGFTLIELLGSIVILVAIALIALPAVLNLLGNSQKEIDDATTQYIENAAREYAADNPNEMPTEKGDSKIIQIGALKTGGYISKSKAKDYEENYSVKITFEGEQQAEYDEQTGEMKTQPYKKYKYELVKNN